MASADTLPCLLQAFDVGELKGKTFRYTNENPRRGAVYDWIQHLTGMTYVQAKNAFDYVRRQHPKAVAEKFSYCQFSGERQKETPVATASGMVWILRRLNRKYVAKFDDKLDELVVRYLGGDTSLNTEVSAIRDAQEQAPEDAPARLFGEAVESGQVGRLRYVRHEGAEALEWQDKREKCREDTKSKSAALKSTLPGIPRAVYVNANCNIGRAAVGKSPADLKRELGIPQRKSARDYMTTPQLNFVCTLEDLTKRMVPSCGGDASIFAQRQRQMCDEGFSWASKWGLHAQRLEETPNTQSIEASPKTTPSIEAAPKRARPEDTVAGRSKQNNVKEPATKKAKMSSVATRQKNIFNFFAPVSSVSASQ